MKTVISQKKAEALLKEKKFHEVISLLTDDALNELQDPSLYNLKAKALGALKQSDLSLEYSQKAIDLDPLYAPAYVSRGGALFLKKIYEKALQDYNKAIEIRDDDPQSYYNRALVWNAKENYVNAIEDSTKAILLDNNYAQAYATRGTSFAKQKEYSKAIDDYTKAISINKQYSIAYNNRGLTFYRIKEYKKALNDFNKAIEFDEGFTNSYYNRALLLKVSGLYEKAISDYNKYIELKNNPEDYFQKIAIAEIDELKKKLADQWYEDIDKIIQSIKQILQFKQSCVTHYTSLSGAKSMILNKSPFRLSEGSFLNDTSEGQELFKYLSFNISKPDKAETISKPFIEKPFIGSFVAESKHNDLTLWRMYGKEAQVEAKGCALTINRETFINNLEATLAESDDKIEAISTNGGKFTFYKVAYCMKDEFLIPGGDKSEVKLLNELLSKLKENIKKIKKNQKPIVAKLLNDIIYLFKSAEYQHENEVRLVIEGIGFSKKIESDPPKVYIELIDIVPVLNKITLGPKIEKADEWAAAFNYFVKNDSNEIEIILSHLPFK